MNNKKYNELDAIGEDKLWEKFIKNTDITVGTLVSNMIAKTGENIVIRRFARFQLGVDQQT